jgi:hypothetical protein
VGEDLKWLTKAGVVGDERSETAESVGRHDDGLGLDVVVLGGEDTRRGRTEAVRVNLVKTYKTLNYKKVFLICCEKTKV